jgi:hypothetical protein
MRSLAVLTALLAVAASAGPNPKIAEARKLFEDLDFERAAKALAAAENADGNDRAQVLEILELQGIVYGTMNKDAKARDAFRELLALNPDYKLGGDHPPRVRTPFYEAKGWVVENAPLQLEPTATAAATVTELSVQLKRDVLRLAKGVRFMVTGGTPSDIVPFVDGAARLPVDAAQVEWRAELIGPKESVLLALGPFTHRGTQAASPPVADAPAKPVGATAVTATASSGWMRPVGYVALGLGAATLLAGGIFGVLSSDDRAKLKSAPVNGAGLIDSFTQRAAAELEATSIRNAIIANVCFVAGSVLAATGAVLFFVGAPESTTQVSLSATPWGALITGAFP